jgi:pimeloyl-ACP methyl ester carboxylesterase
LRFYDTVTTARDMDRVRAALRLPALDYLGFSYGTELGAAYAHLFPRRTGAIVLDGAVDPLLSGLDLLTQQMQGFEAAFDQFAAWCRRHSSCSTLDDPRGAAEQILATTAREPLPTGQPRRLTATLADIGIAEALYSQALWPTLATALVQARSGVGAGLLALADEYYQRRSDGSYSNLFDAYNVIWCNDSPRGPSDARLRATVQSWARRFPIFGKWSALQLFMCQRWPVPPTVLPRPTAATPTKVLVLGNLHDPATPYRGTKDLARAMGNAEVLTWNGQGHTSYLQGSGCIDRYVDDYLISAELPPEGTVCRK